MDYAQKLKRLKNFLLKCFKYIIKLNLSVFIKPVPWISITNIWVSFENFLVNNSFNCYFEMNFDLKEQVRAVGIQLSKYENKSLNIVI